MPRCDALEKDFAKKLIAANKRLVRIRLADSSVQTYNYKHTDGHGGADVSSESSSINPHLCKFKSALTAAYYCLASSARQSAVPKTNKILRSTFQKTSKAQFDFQRPIKQFNDSLSTWTKICVKVDYNFTYSVNQGMQND